MSLPIRIIWPNFLLIFLIGYKLLTIHTFGDSHALFPWKNIHIKDVVIKYNHLGPRLMYSIGRDGFDISGYGVQPGDVVIFCFGEIDCRRHIYKYKEHYKQNIDNMVENYFKMIDKNKEVIPDSRICVYNIIPPVRKNDAPVNPLFPHSGTDEERKTYVAYMNSKLREHCKNKDYIFFDIYNSYVDKSGFLNKKLKDASVHIKNPVYIIKFITDHFL